MNLENNVLTRRTLIKAVGASAAVLLLQPLFGSFLCEASVYPDKNNPVLFDKHKKAVLIYTESNLKNLKKKNPHWGIVFKDGRLVDKAIFTSYCSPGEFHDALTAIGAKAGNNLTEQSTGESIKGDILDVTAYWETSGGHYKLREVLEDSSNKGFTIRFGGNKSAALKEQTGCIMCLESCWIGITSNSEYPLIGSFQRFISPNSWFKGNLSILPPIDGQPVIFQYKLV